MEQRLQKLISLAHVASRRAAERLLEAGRVCVNGVPATLGQSADPETDLITVDGVPLTFAGAHTYIMLNKPRGYVTTLSDEKGRRCVAELVADAGVRLYPVGRLDLNSDGLLLMTDDGALANALMHPSREVDKTYRTVVEGDLPAALETLGSPLVLDGRPIRPAAVHQTGANTVELTIHEGRNRQVRRMCAMAGLKVLRLTRVAEGPLRLGDLPSGKWRYLTEAEIKSLKEEIG